MWSLHSADTTQPGAARRGADYREVNASAERPLRPSRDRKNEFVLGEFPGERRSPRMAVKVRRGSPLLNLIDRFLIDARATGGSRVRDAVFHERRVLNGIRGTVLVRFAFFVTFRGNEHSENTNAGRNHASPVLLTFLAGKRTGKQIAAARNVCPVGVVQERI